MQAISILGQLFRGYTLRTGTNNLGGSYVSHKNHIVVGGCGRSGTTLVRIILDSHPNICCGPESDVFLSDSLKLRKLQDKFKLDPSALRDAYRRSESRAQFIDQLSEICCRAEKKPRWAEKTPRNVLHLDYVFEKFPKAQFVHVLRDGRDVACSLRTHPRHKVKNGKLVPLNTWKPMRTCAQRWRDSLLAAKPYWSDRRFYTLRYEELVTTPRTCIEKLLGFLGERWNDALLAHSKAQSHFRDATTFPQNPEALQPIATSAVARWQHDMSDEDKRIFKSIAGDLLIECGYATDHNW